MCGIAGFVNLDDRPADPIVLEGMIRTIKYRGPDGSGIHTDGAVGLAHNRLSIIDIAGGYQPMQCDNGALSIIFNGEIFNFVELREELAQKGYEFSTRSDTEVILRLYQAYGPDCVHHMNGQWAFAIWDAKARRLFLSRDRLGVRPLFYSNIGRTFLFASEIKALLAHPGADRQIDWQTLGQIFTFWFPVSPRTIFKGVHELPPGHSLILDGRKIDVRRYWQIDYSQAGSARVESPQQEQAIVDEFCHLLLDATRIRLRADVPVGAYLSGGLDSSITTALAQKFVGSSLCTFSVAFEDPSLDESRYQAEVVQSLRTKHHTIRCSTSQIGQVFPQVIRHTETPILRTAPAPLFLLSGLVRENGYKVVLTGEGSDEFLGGYDIYKEAKIRAFWAAQIDSKRRPLLLKRLYPYLENIQKQSPAYLQAFFHCRPEHVADPFFSHVPRWELTSRTQVFFSAAVRSELQANKRFAAVEETLPEGFSTWGTFSRAQYLEAAFFLPGYLLSSQGDRVAMAHSVEGRYPFLDYRIVEFSAKLPPHLKMKVLNEKYLLKRAFGNLVPLSVRKRPKQPYRAPDAISFFDSVAGKARYEYVDDMLSPERIRAGGVFDTRAVQKLVDKARAGKVTGFVENAALVGILSTQILIDQFALRPEEAFCYGEHRTAGAAVSG